MGLSHGSRKFLVILLLHGGLGGGVGVLGCHLSALGRLQLFLVEDHLLLYDSQLPLDMFRRLFRLPVKVLNTALERSNVLVGGLELGIGDMTLPEQRITFPNEFGALQGEEFVLGRKSFLFSIQLHDMLQLRLEVERAYDVLGARAGNRRGTDIRALSLDHSAAR